MQPDLDLAYALTSSRKHSCAKVFAIAEASANGPVKKGEFTE